MGYNIIWYNGENFHTVITKEMLINKGGKKINAKSKPFINIGAGFDCETSQFDNHLNFTKNGDAYRDALKSFVYIWQFSVGTDIYLCRYVNLFEQFLSDLDTACSVHHNAQLIVWDANLSFEYSFFKHIFNAGITKIFAKSKTCILSFNYGSHLLFRECLGAFGKSLEQIAKNYTTTQKLVGDIDYDKIRTPETPLSHQEIHYSVNDVAILSELTQYAHRQYTLKGRKIPLTQTGIVRDEIMMRYAPNPYIKSLIYNQNKTLIGSQNEYYTFRKYVYSGGLTHSNFYYVGKLVNDVTCYDLTSAYPWALNTNYYPAGAMIHAAPEQYSEAFKHKHWFFKVLLSDVESRSTHSTLSMHKMIHMKNAIIDNGRVYKADALIAWFTEVDWQNFRMIYDYDKSKSKILDVYFFTKSARVPSKILSVMNEWYKEKTILKPLTHKSHKHDKEYEENVKRYKYLKQLINSVYGMTVTSLYDIDIILDDNTLELKEQSKEWDDISNTVFNPWYGYYCTAYVRQRLIQCISKFPDYIIQYDTDSIYCLPNEELNAYIQEINKQVSDENCRTISTVECLDLGLWDNDGYYKKFLCLGSKRYVGQYETGEYKITFAGASETDILKQSEIHHTDLFTYIINFSIPENLSTKKGAYHFSGVYSAYVTDYLGNKCLCTTYGGTTVKTVDFKASLSHNFKHLSEIYLNDNIIPDNLNNIKNFTGVNKL